LATQELDASLRLKFWQRRSAPSIATERADESPRERVKREDLNAAVGAPQDIGGGASNLTDGGLRESQKEHALVG